MEKGVWGGCLLCPLYRLLSILTTQKYNNLFCQTKKKKCKFLNAGFDCFSCRISGQRPYFVQVSRSNHRRLICVCASRHLNINNCWLTNLEIQNYYSASTSRDWVTNKTINKEDNVSEIYRTVCFPFTLGMAGYGAGEKICQKQDS